MIHRSPSESRRDRLDHGTALQGMTWQERTFRDDLDMIAIAPRATSPMP
jgi:hypothetical protein